MKITRQSHNWNKTRRKQCKSYLPYGFVSLSSLITQILSIIISTPFWVVHYMWQKKKNASNCKELKT